MDLQTLRLTDSLTNSLTPLHTDSHSGGDDCGTVDGGMNMIPVTLVDRFLQARDR